MDSSGFTIPPKLYDFLKYVALVILPAAAALVLGIGVILSWNAATETAGAITLVDTFLGAILGKSATNFKQQDPQAFGDLTFKSNPDGSAEVVNVAVNQANPVFTEGAKVYLNVVRQVDQK